MKNSDHQWGTAVGPPTGKSRAQLCESGQPANHAASHPASGPVSRPRTQSNRSRAEPNRTQPEPNRTQNESRSNRLLVQIRTLFQNLAQDFSCTYDLSPVVGPAGRTPNWCTEGPAVHQIGVRRPPPYTKLVYGGPFVHHFGAPRAPPRIKLVYTGPLQGLNRCTKRPPRD